jgi:hypothetical protein
MGYDDFRLHASAVAAAALIFTALPASGRAHGDSTDAANGEGASADGPIQVCKLLTTEEVSSVLPKHDGGMQVASGPGLTKNIQNYQCSYSAVRGNDADLMTVIVSVAADSAAFRSIKPRPASKKDDFPIFKELTIGEGAILYGKPGDIKVETWNGKTVVELELIVPQAERHADALARMASIVASKVK